MAQLELDTFVRGATSNAWGTSTNGDAWYNRQGAAASLSTTGTQGKIANSAGTRSHVTLGVSTYEDTDVIVRATPSNSADDFGVTARATGDATVSSFCAYRASFAGNTLTLARVNNGAVTSLATATKSFTLTASTIYWIEMYVSGSSPIRLRARVWLASGSQPTYDIDFIDSSASLLTTGSCGANGIAAASTGIVYDNFSATDGSASALTDQMQLYDLEMQHDRIEDSPIGNFLQILATTYYQLPTAPAAPLGELDAVLNTETIANLHVLRTISDVNSFIIQYFFKYTVLADTPMAFYRLADSAGATTAADSSGLLPGLPGTVSGGVTFGQAGALPNDPSTAALFDGSTGYISAPSNITPAGWTNLTVEFAIKLASLTGTPRVLANSHTDSDHNGIQVTVNNTGTVTLHIGNGSSAASVTTTSALAVGTWARVGFTWNGATMTAYFNGVAQATAAASGAISAASNPLNIGRSPVTGDYTNATIQGVLLYNAALSAARMLAHSQAPNGIA